jgi:hypothetical protein
MARRVRNGTARAEWHGACGPGLAMLTKLVEAAGYDLVVEARPSATLGEVFPIRRSVNACDADVAP